MANPWRRLFSIFDNADEKRRTQRRESARKEADSAMREARRLTAAFWDEVDHADRVMSSWRRRRG